MQFKVDHAMIEADISGKSDSSDRTSCNSVLRESLICTQNRIREEGRESLCFGLQAESVRLPGARELFGVPDRAQTGV